MKKVHMIENGPVRVAVRCVQSFESDNIDTKVKIRVFDTEFETEFSHNEIKTFIIDNKNVLETNLIEWRSDKDDRI